MFGDLLGGHVGHDGGHFAVSRIPYINDIALWCMSFVTNPIIWQHQHTYAHHSFTNDDERDPDLYHNEGLRKVRNNAQKNDKSIFYTLLMYSGSTFGLCCYLPNRFIVDRSFYGIVRWEDRKRWLRTIGYLHI